MNGYASTPFNVAVGGTDFYLSSFDQGDTAIDAQLATYWNTTPSNNTPTASLLQYIPEQPWNDSQYGDNLISFFNDIAGGEDTIITAAGGGASNCSSGSGATYYGWTACTAGYPKPAWQSTGIAGVPSDGVRDLPDVSLFAANGLNGSYFPECSADGDCQPVSSGGTVQITGVGGTSASAPAFAGIMALVNQATGSRQGQADAILYPLWKQFPAAFHDVTVGTVSVPCVFAPTAGPDCIAVTDPIVLSSGITEGEIGSGTTPEYDAGTGYDLATGLGTIDAYNLVTDWSQVKFAATATTLTPSSTSFTHGTAITVTGSVTGGATPTGNVALMTDSASEAQQGQALFTLNGGSYTSAANYANGINFLPGGQYHIWGQYGGDTGNAMSSSTPVEITVSPEPSAIDLNMVAYSASGDTIYNPGAGPAANVDYGIQLLLSAAVAPSSLASALQDCLVNDVGCGTLSFTTATGAVIFRDNSTTLNTAVLNAAGDAEYVAAYAVGAHSVTASYSGDNSYTAAATTAPIAFTVAKDTPTVLYSYSSYDISANLLNGAGEPTVITFLVENGYQYSSHYPVPIAAPTGTVTLSSSVNGLSGTASLTPIVDRFTDAVASIATFTVPAGTVNGTVDATFSYSGDANYNAIDNEAGSITFQNIGSDGLAPSTTTASVSGSVSPDSTVSVTGQVTGQGTAAPTGGVYIYTSGEIPVAAGFLSSAGNVSNFAAVLNSQSLVKGTNFITVQYSGDSNYNASAVVLNTAVQNTLSDFTMVPVDTIVAVAAGGSGSATINLGSVNGFTGLVDLSCAAATVTCSVTPTVSLSSGGSGTATLTVSAAAGTADATYNVLVTGKDGVTGEYIHTLGFQAMVAAAAPGFALSNSGAIAVSPGAATGNTSAIRVTPANGFTGSVSLTCSIGPTAASDPATCSLFPTSVTISGATAQTSTLTIATTAASSAMSRPVKLFWPSTGDAVLALVLVFHTSKRRRGWLAMLGLLVFFAAAGGMGCGGSLNSGGGGGNSGTTAGTYTVTVTGTPSTGAAQTTSVMLTVN